MDAPVTDQKPSVEIQAVVMQLWNVVRETSQASAGAVSERNTLAKKYAAMEVTLQQEAQKTGKMQAYIEHLQEEARQKDDEFAQLQQQYHDIQEMIRHHEETIRALRQSVREQEEVVITLNAHIQEQAHNIEERVGEILTQEDELERLRDELGASNERAIASAQELGELQPLYIELQEEKVLLTEENGQLRWQLTAVTEQTSQERATLEAAQERKLTDAHAENGRLLVAMEDISRLWNEGEQRIRVLEAEREETSAKVQQALQKATEDALAWQHIAEEQEQTFASKEQALREELVTASNDSERVSQLQSDLQAAHNLLLLEKIAHDQAIQLLTASHAQEREQLRASLSEELDVMRNTMQAAQTQAQTAYVQVQTEHSQAIERVAELETTVATLEANLSAQAQTANERKQQAAQAHSYQAAEEFSAILSEKLAEQQTVFDVAIEKYKREAQIRLEMELDVTRQVLSMKDREIELLRTNIETLQATTSRAEASADEREVRIMEMEALLRDLEAQRTKLEHTSHASPNLPSMSDSERTVLATKVRQMLSRVEAALEEEVR